MKIHVSNAGVSLIREPGDKALSHESTVTHHIRRLLRESGETRFVRFNPSESGLTDCRQGVGDWKADVLYWHDRYQVEAAHKAFNNNGRVFYVRAGSNS